MGISYGSITVTDITDITDVYLQYCMAADTYTTAAAIAAKTTWTSSEVNWFTLTTDTTVINNKRYYRLSSGNYYIVTPAGSENPSTNGWYENSSYPTWQPGYQIWIREVTIKEGIELPEYGTPYLDKAVNQINTNYVNLNNKLKTFFYPGDINHNYSGAFAVSKTENDGLNTANADTYGFNTRVATGLISMGYNKIPLLEMGLFETGTPANGIKLYSPILTNGVITNHRLDATLSTDGLKLLKGGIVAGDYAAGQNGYIYLSTENGPRISIDGFTPGTGQNDPQWRAIIGTNFGVDSEGNLYAAGAHVNGDIIAQSLTIGSGSSAYNGMAAININGYDIEITSDSTGVINPDTSIYLYPHLYHNGAEIEYLLSVDTEVDNSKTYYTRSGTAGNYTYTIVPNPTGNPNTNQYYEHIDYTNFIWYQDNVEPGTTGDVNNQGRYLATYGHNYRVTYDFDDGAVSGGTQVQTRTIDPSKYITKINDTGITIHPEVWTNQSSYIQLTGSGMELFNSNGNSIAQYGSTARVGLSNSSRFLINNNSLQAYDNNNNKYFEVTSNGLSWGNNTAATIVDVEDAAATATNYISYIDSTNGIRIYDGRSENEDINFAQINSNGLQVYQGGTASSNKVAEFGTNGAQIGQNGSTRTEIGSNKTEWYMNNDRLAGALYYSPTESSNSQIESGTITRSYGVDYWSHSLFVSNEGILEVSASGNITYNGRNPEAIGTFNFDEYITLEEYETHIWGGTYNISYVGDGVTKSFSLANVENFAGSIESVFVGTTMVTNYTLNGTTITFNVAPASGTLIEIYPNQYYYFKTYEIPITLSSGTTAIFYITIEKDSPIIYCGFSEKTPIEGASLMVVEAEMSYTSELKYFFTITGEKVLFGQSNANDIVASSTNIHNTLRVGKYSIINKVNQPPFVIGNGTADDARSNALTVDWSGNINIAGHTNPIGWYDAHNNTSSISSGTSYQSISASAISLAPGRYMLFGSARFSGASSGYRGITIFEGSSSLGRASASQPAIPSSSWTTALNCSCFVAVNSTTTYKLGVYQNSGSSLSTAWGFYAVAIR